MGQIGPDITFDELKKMYLDSLELLDKVTTENSVLAQKNAELTLRRPAHLCPDCAGSGVRQIAYLTTVCKRCAGVGFVYP